MADFLIVAFGIGCIWVSGYIAGRMRQRDLDADQARKEGARAFMDSWPGRAEV
jgi:hypothetical protein